MKNYDFDYINNLAYEERMVLFFTDYTYTYTNKTIERELSLVGKELGKTASKHKAMHKKIIRGFEKFEKDFTKPQIIIDGREINVEEKENSKDKALSALRKIKNAKLKDK